MRHTYQSYVLKRDFLNSQPGILTIQNSNRLAYIYYSSNTAICDIRRYSCVTDDVIDVIILFQLS